MRHDKQNKFISQFNGNTGVYIRSGILDGNNEDTGVDPFMSSFPELIDIGVMEQCACSNKCSVGCYQKAYERTGSNMSLEDFEWVIEQCKRRVYQVALGGAGDPDTHDDFEQLLHICYKSNIVPNFTTSGICMTKNKAELCKKYCGAVAVSEHFADYTNKAVDLLVESGVRTNIHYVLSRNTVEYATNILNGAVKYRDGINAIVFLLYKPVGLGKITNVLNAERDNEQLQRFFEALDNRQLPFKVGFDSCMCPAIVTYSRNLNTICMDYCEAARFSMYIDAQLNAMPCSFTNQNNKWFYKLDRNNNRAIESAWNSELFSKFRQQLKGSCTGCEKKEICGGKCPLLNEISICNKELDSRGWGDKHEDKNRLRDKFEQQ